MKRKDSLRGLVLACIDAHSGFMTARQVAEWTGLDYKTVIDALQAVHNQGLIVRSGRKFSAKWGSLALRPAPCGWQALAAAWYGRPAPAAAGKAGPGGEAEGRGDSAWFK